MYGYHEVIIGLTSMHGFSVLKTHKMSLTNQISLPTGLPFIYSFIHSFIHSFIQLYIIHLVQNYPYQSALHQTVAITAKIAYFARKVAQNVITKNDQTLTAFTCTA